MDPYVPRRILLGHDTTKIADRRCVESTVSLLLPNLKWFPKLAESGMSLREDELWQDGQLRNQRLKESTAFMEWRQQVSMIGNYEGTSEPNYIPIDPQLQLDSSLMDFEG